MYYYITNRDDVWEIPEAEYNAFLAEVRAYVEQITNGEITIDDVPAEWREEVQHMLAISGNELITMLERVV